MKEIICLSAVLAAACAGTASTGTVHARLSAPSGVRVAKVVAFGSGCLGGNVSPILSGDSGTLSFRFTELDAQLDPTVTPSINNPSEACDISLQLDSPVGWSFAIVSAEHSGRADLGDQTLGQQTSKYWFRGSADQRVTFSTTFIGPASGARYWRREQPNEGVVWSSCDQHHDLIIDADVSVSNTRNPTAKAYMKDLGRTYELIWRRCT